MKCYLKGLRVLDFEYFRQQCTQLDNWHSAYSEVKHLKLPEIYFVSDYRDEQSTRIVGPHQSLTRNKKRQVFKLIEMFDRRPTEIKGWDSHHIVEGQDFADIDLTGSLSILYKDGLPCVMIPKSEHDAYSLTLRDEKTRSELYTHYRPELLERYPNQKDRAIHSAKIGKPLLQMPSGKPCSSATSQQLQERIEGLRKIYRDLYRGDFVLYKIAMNVFDEVRRSIT